MTQSLATNAKRSTCVPLVAAFGLTDVGQSRTTNEDTFLLLHDLGLFAVADGMGGAACGEVASKMTIDSVREMFERSDTTWPTAHPPSRTPGARLLMAGIQRANNLVRAAARKDVAKDGMGTTFAGILVLEDRVVIAHVGDSRVYRLRHRQLDLLTEDHSLLNAYIRTGEWDPANAHSFPQPNAITRAVGAEDDIEVETRLDALVPDDVYLICSDGLHGTVDHKDIRSVLLGHKDPTLAVARLIEMANDNGGPDNITAVVVRIVKTGVRP